MYRRRNGLTQHELAKKFGVSGPTLARWESGQRKPEFYRLRLIYEVTGIAPMLLRPELLVALNR